LIENHIKDKNNILEIGSGPCFLLSYLTKKFPQKKIVGIEPTGEGFNRYKSYISKLKKKYKFNLFEKGYEEFRNASTKYNIIFSINVIEHVKSWKNFIKFASNNLSGDGICILAFPNYSFPYESHFNLPIIINKKITRILFKNTINKHEVNNDSDGLWNSLNFIKLNDVLSFCAKNNLKTVVNYNIIDFMISRISTDKEFKNRKKIIGLIGRFLKITRLLVIFKIPFLKRFIPYAFVIIKKDII
jgi:2-polyprenyl-3-methyl-5-hydroxy-6-metoxy-1,4-benzoquinol methylase